MFDYKIILGAAAVVLGVLAYAPYLKSIFYGQTRPHLFSWLVWFLIQGIGFFAQMSKGAGAGAWVTGLTAFLCFSVFIASFFKGEKNITKLDIASFLGAMLALVLWFYTSNPLIAIVLISVTDFLGFVPTFRKAYYKPQEEAVIIYEFYVLVWLLSLLALRSYNPTTVIYPASLFITNLSFAVMSFFRKRALGK